MRALFHNIQAAVELPDALTPAGAHPSPMINAAIRDAAIVVGAGFALTALILVWAVYFRGPRKRAPVKSKSVSRSSHPDGLVKTDEVEGSSGRRKSKYRRRRRDHRNRNPTLAETGGLPPERLDHG